MQTHARFTRISILSAALLFVVGTLSALAGRALMTNNGGNLFFQKLTGPPTNAKPIAAGSHINSGRVARNLETAALTQLFTNEIHYDNLNADLGERVEIACPPGMSLTGWSLYFYTGDNGTVYSTINLTSVAANMPASQGNVGGEPLSTIVADVVALTGLSLVALLLDQFENRCNLGRVALRFPNETLISFPSLPGNTELSHWLLIVYE